MGSAGPQDKGKEIAFFDTHAASDEYDVFTPEANARLIEAFVRWSGLPQAARVADLGCGSGVFTELLRRRGYMSVGVDISPKLVALGRSKYPGLELIEGDAESLPFENEKSGRRAAERTGASFSRPKAARGRGWPSAQAGRALRRLRPQPDESVHVALSRPLLAIL